MVGKKIVQFWKEINIDGKEINYGSELLYINWERIIIKYGKINHSVTK